jgi:hypothetical protein
VLMGSVAPPPGATIAAGGSAAATGDSLQPTVSVQSGTPTGLPAVQGFGRNALVSLGTESYVISSTASGSGAGTLGGALAWAAAGHQGTVTWAIDGTFTLPDQINRYNNASNVFFDARNHSVAIQGGCLALGGTSPSSNWNHFTFANVAFTGGWNGGQDADCVTICGGSDYAFVNCSFRGFYDESLDIAYPSHHITVQDCLFGPGGPPLGNARRDHSFAGGIGCYTYAVSHVRSTFIDPNYRTPRVDYWNSNGPVQTVGGSPCWNGSNYDGGIPPNGIICDIVNPVYVDVVSVIAVYGRGLTNVRQPYLLNSGSSFSGSAIYATAGGTDGYLAVRNTYEVSTGAVNSDYGFGTGSNPYHTVPAAYLVSELSPSAAAAYAKLHSGPRNAAGASANAFDTAQLARIP